MEIHVSLSNDKSTETLRISNELNIAFSLYVPYKYKDIRKLQSLSYQAIILSIFHKITGQLSSRIATIMPVCSLLCLTVFSRSSIETLWLKC